MTTQSDAAFLLSPQGRELAERFSSQPLDESNHLSLLDQLRREVSPDRAGALLSLLTARHRARGRFPQSDQLFLTAEALEQSTAWPIAHYRAQWIHAHAPPGPILDLGCGIGGDLLALAQYREVIGYEVDPVRAQFAQANAIQYGLDQRVQIECKDWVAALDQGTLRQASAAFVDPARRSNGKRVFHVEGLLPPLSTILRLRNEIPAICVKLMPGIQDKEIPPGSSITFISHEGTCKEAMLWLDEESYTQPEPLRRAAIYQQGEWIERASSLVSPPLGELAPGLLLHEPDPALIRAGAFAELCDELDGWLFDPQIAYLVTSNESHHPLTSRFRIREIHPFNLKQLNQRISVLNIGQVELKKRGAPFEPESLRKRLKLVPGGEAAVIIFTRQGDDRLMMIGGR